jgi:hypothetical protein
MRRKAALLAAAVTLSPLIAVADNGNNHPGWLIGNGNPHGAAPAPVIGAGLPGIALAGLAYLVFRHRRKKG